MNHETLKWEGAIYQHEASDKSIGLPFRCDGCEQMTHAAEVFSGHSKEGDNYIPVNARWCPECVQIVRAAQS